MASLFRLPAAYQIKHELFSRTRDQMERGEREGRKEGFSFCLLDEVDMSHLLSQRCTDQRPEGSSHRKAAHDFSKGRAGRLLVA